MKVNRLLSMAAIALVLVLTTALPSSLALAAPVYSGAAAHGSAAAAVSPCVTSAPATNAYAVTVCFTGPANGGVLSGSPVVTATAAVQINVPGPVTPRVQRLSFYLDGIYLLTDYQSPYTFNLPSDRWVDGAYTLGVQALMRDGYLTNMATENVTLSNGVTKPPVNHNQFTPAVGTTPPPGQPFVVMATGDGASGESNSAQVVNLVAAANPNLFLYLGDVYENGSPAEFADWYGTAGNNFSKFSAITDPTVGNHEYISSSGADGYFYYWNNVPNYYSFDAGGWHFISLNSNLGKLATGGAAAQTTWLQKDLAANPNACTIVFYHHPLYNIGPEGADTRLASIWALLAQHHVSIVLNSHDHDYQRWVPLDANGNPDPNGITEFVAGGGGHDLAVITNTDPRVAYANSTYPTALGALKLSLTAKAAAFSYLSIDGTVLDSGTVACK